MALIAIEPQRTDRKSAQLLRFCGLWGDDGAGCGALPRPKWSLYRRKVEKDDEARSAALALLARGMITPSQAAELAGVSRQLVRYWLRHAGIDWRRAWSRRQASMWRREIAALNGKVLRPPTKKEMRERAKRAKAVWDARRALLAAQAKDGGPH